MERIQTSTRIQSLLLLLIMGTAGCFEDQNKESSIPDATVETPEERREVLDELMSEISVRRSDDSPLAGRWEVMNVIRTPISVITDQEAFEMLGIRVVYSKTKVVVLNDACMDTSYKTRIETFADYFREFEIPAEQLRVKTDLFEVVRLSCDGLEWHVAGAEVVPVEQDRLLIISDGTVIVLRR